jgi:Holliday junction DNA helicase RuvA
VIRRIRGTVESHTPDTVEILTPSGVGYEVHVPLGLAERIAGGEAELHTVLVVRDDAMELFGFDSSQDRELFRRLRTASGVGPRLALAILGALPANRVVRAIRGKDHATLQTVSGVGKKTAERIVVELTDKLDDLGISLVEPEASTGGARAAIQALRGLGYGPSDSDAAVRRAMQALGGRDVSTEELVKHALQYV